MKRNLFSVRNVSTGLVLSLVGGVAAASDPYAAITSAIDFSDVTTVIIAAAAALAAVYVLRKGVRMALSMAK